MTTLQSRTVAPRALRRWSRCALELISRRWLLVLGLNAAQFAVFAAIVEAEIPIASFAIMFGYPGFAAMLFALVAECIDQHTPVVARFKSLHWKTWASLYAASATSIALVVVLGLALRSLKSVFSIESSPDEGMEMVFVHLFTIHATLTLSVFVPIIAGGIGTMPSLFIQGVRWTEALALGIEASSKNRFTELVALIIVVIAAMAFTGIHGITGIPLLIAAVLGVLMPPFLGAMLYVAFRDIFLHQGENSKEKVAVVLRQAKVTG